MTSDDWKVELAVLKESHKNLTQEVSDLKQENKDFRKLHALVVKSVIASLLGVLLYVGKKFIGDLG